MKLSEFKGIMKVNIREPTKIVMNFTKTMVYIRAPTKIYETSDDFYKNCEPGEK